MSASASSASRAIAPDPALWPSRHGADLVKARRTARPLRMLIRGVDPEPTPDEWHSLGTSLTRGDPIADRLALSMRGGGMQAGMARFEQALEHGIASVPDAPPELRDFFAAVEARPAWVDEARLAAGARACHVAGRLGMRVLRDAALMAGYQASAINRTLVLTGALAKGAQRRVAETTKWWLDVTAEGGTARQGAGFKSTMRVRLIHAMVRQRVRRMPEWDAAELGEPVNQADMLATYLSFSVIYLFGQRVMGVKLSRQEAEDAMHLWRYIGWLMGVEEGLLVDDEMSGRVRLFHVLLSQAPADDSSKQLGRALMDEPLTRHYPRWQKLTGRMERARHLSIVRLFVGREGMHDLGLPTATLPWYPVLTVPWVGLWHRLVRLAPGGRGWLARRGRHMQDTYLAILFGAASPELAQVGHPAAHGAAGTHVRPLS